MTQFRVCDDAKFIYFYGKMIAIDLMEHVYKMVHVRILVGFLLK